MNVASYGTAAHMLSLTTDDLDLRIPEVNHIYCVCGEVYELYH
jgi:hypothetical protein